MDVGQWIGLSSFAGAGLFFSAGYVARRAFGKSDPGSPELLGAEQEARSRAEQQAAALQQQHDQLAR